MAKDYWKDRQARALTNLSNKSAKAIEEQLRKYYAQTMRRTIADFEATFDKLQATAVAGRQPTPADLYKLDKYWEAQAQLKKELQRLGDKEAALLGTQFENSYKDIYRALAKDSGAHYSRISTQGAEQMIKQVWAADGKSWSKRIWDNTEDLAATLNEKLIECVVGGKKTSDLKKALMDRFNVSFSRADALARTELAHIQTQAARQRYEDTGIEYVEIWADEDERRCEVCGKLHQKRYPVGAKMPIPAHPRCRCTIIPVVDIPEDEEKKQDIPQSETIQRENDYTTKTKELQSVNKGLKDIELKQYYIMSESERARQNARKDELLQKQQTLLNERKELAKDIDVLRPHTLASVDVGEPMSFTDANGGKPNPRYKQDVSYRVNCQTCVVALEGRYRGYDVMATGNKKDGGANHQLSYNTALAWVDTETGTQPKYIKPVATTAKSVKKWCEENLKDDARYTIEYAWRGYRSGHIQSIRKLDGELMIYDPQTSIKYTGDDLVSLLQETKISSIKLLRVDNVEFNPEFIDDLLEASE